MDFFLIKTSLIKRVGSLKLNNLLGEYHIKNYFQIGYFVGL